MAYFMSSHGLSSYYFRFCGILLPVVQNLFHSLSNTKRAEFAKSVDLDEVAHNEPLHLDLHCLPSSR